MWLAILLAVVCVRPAAGWYDTTTTARDMYTSTHEPLPKEHNPAPGVLKMRRSVRRDNLAADRSNAVRVLQARSETAQVAMLANLRDPPVIGRISPSVGSTQGGTNITAWGTKLGGGSLYKCKFHKKGKRW